MKNSIQFPQLLDCALLADIGQRAKTTFLNGCSARTYDDPTVFIRQGDQPDGLVFIADGKVEVAYLSEDGNQSVVFLAGECEILGLVEAVAERPYAATCTAFPGATILFCPQALLTKQLTSRVFLRNFAIDMHETLLRDNKSKAVHQFYTAEQRICSFLHELSEHDTELRLNQSYLADIAGCSRQTVNRELGHLRDLDVITVGKGRIGVRNRKGLITRIEELSEVSQRHNA